MEKTVSIAMDKISKAVSGLNNLSDVNIEVIEETKIINE
jgi:hypothetical protein